MAEKCGIGRTAAGAELADVAAEIGRGSASVEKSTLFPPRPKIACVQPNGISA